MAQYNLLRIRFWRLLLASFVLMIAVIGTVEVVLLLVTEVFTLAFGIHLSLPRGMILLMSLAVAGLFLVVRTIVWNVGVTETLSVTGAFLDKLLVGTDVLVEGRIEKNGYLWNVKYRTGGRITVDHRKCPTCGVEVIEKTVPESMLYRQVPTETDENDESISLWENVTGRDAFGHSPETTALVCPECSFASPGEKELMPAADAVKATFREHIDRMKREGSTSDPFGAYRNAAKANGVSDPGPSDLWNAYMNESENNKLGERSLARPVR